MGFISEFKEFALKGNVMDLAVGVIIGAAFNKIVTSVVDDLIMPIVGIFGNADFSNLYLPLSEKVQKAKEAAEQVNSALPLAKAKELGPVFAYGNFLTIVLNFAILAFIIFWMIKGMNKMKRKNADLPPPPAPPTKEEVLLTEIRDALRAGK